MELKLARAELSSKPETITLEKIEKELEKSGQKIYYLDKENSHKDFIKLIEHFEKKGQSVYHTILKYGLNEDDFMYEVHIF